MKTKRMKGAVARMMVENRRAYAPRVIGNKKRSAQLRPKHRAALLADR